MKISEIQNDENLRRELFPVVKKGIYLAHAGVCSLPSRVVERISDYATDCTTADQEDVVPSTLLPEIRSMSAGLCGVSADEIALVGPTSNALSLIASGVDFQPGQNVVIYFDDYPSNVYPWMALKDMGVEVRYVHVDRLGEISVENVSAAINSNTRLVALASCHFLAGYRIDIDAIGAMLRERNILFSLDMIQTLGAFPTPLKHVDFAAADAHKWLLGPCAAGVMYVRSEIQPSFTPPVYGWHNIRCPDFISQPDLVFRTDARKYEAGSANFLGLFALHECLRIVNALGVQNIADDLTAKRKFLVGQLTERNMQILSPEPGQAHAGGMTSFFRSDLDLPMIHRKLAENNISVSLRRDRSMQQYLRLSPHYYNNMNDFDRFFSVLDQLLA